MIWLYTFLLLAALFVALAIFHFRSAPRTANLADLDVLCDTELDRYAHVRRLLAPDDFQYLASSRRGIALVSRLRDRRLQVLSRYLVEMREEFYSLVAIGSLFAAAPTARSERFAQRIASMRFRFELLSMRLRVAIWLNGILPWAPDVSPLLQHIRSLRSQADDVLHRLTPDDLATLRAALRAAD